MGTRVAAVGLLLMVVSGTAEGQQQQVGLKLGPTFASASIETPQDDGDYGWKAGVSGGGFVVQPFAPHLAVQIEALFAPRGTTLESGFEGVESKLSLDWLEIPVMARVFGPAAPNRSFHLVAGPYIAMRASAKAETRVSGTITSGVREDVSDQFHFFDVGLVAGAGVDIGRRFVVDARYSWGLRDVENSDEAVVRNRAVTILAGIRF